MAELPEAYRYDRIAAGTRAPDYDALDQALPPENEGPIIDDMRQLGDTILDIGEALPKIGLQGTFAYIYGTLTHRLADAVDGRPPAGRLPQIENPDDLIRQAGYFADTWITPLRHYLEQAKAARRGDNQAQHHHATQIGRHYRYSFDAPGVQFGQPVIQFTAGGMENHIVGDLGTSLIQSGVSPAYMRRGGDYDNVNAYIRYVTLQRASELMAGNESMVYAAVQPVPLAIAGMRRYARFTYERLRRSDSQEEYDSITLKAEGNAAWLSKQTVQYGQFALAAFARIAGAERSASRQERRTDESEAA